MLDRFADFLNRAHPGNLVLTRPDMKSKEKARLSPNGCMSRVEKIKAAIEQLSPEERCELAALLNPIKAEDWDRQMKNDAEPGGKLDRLMEAASNDYKEGKSLPFPKPAEFPL